MAFPMSRPVSPVVASVGPTFKAIYPPHHHSTKKRSQCRPADPAWRRPATSHDGGSSEREDFPPPPSDSNLDALTEDPVIHDLLYGMGSSGQSGARPIDAPDPMTREEAAEAVAMGAWRLRPVLCPPLLTLASQMEARWRAALPDLAQCHLPDRYRYMDSAYPEGSQPMSHLLPSPGREDPGWPRLQIENRAYSSHAFRKLHLEVAVRQDGLQIVHCVMYPRLQFDLPILSLDMVAVDGRVTLAIVDPCPVTANLTLPPHYEGPVRQLRERYGAFTNRGVPDWGAAIFSRLCVCVRPTGPQDVSSFLKYAIALTEFHVQIGRLAAPVRAGGGESDASASRRREEIRAAHERYAMRQLENDKTKRVLERTFGNAVADEYMRTVMFDVPVS